MSAQWAWSRQRRRRVPRWFRQRSGVLAQYVRARDLEIAALALAFEDDVFVPMLKAFVSYYEESQPCSK